MEDSLRSDGHLGKLARSMGWCESKAGGRLWFFYRHTQQEGIITDTADRITNAVITDFDDDAEVIKWLNAMVAAKLATKNEDGTYRIHGNEKHVERIANLKEHASQGGKKSQQKKRNDSQTVSLAVAQADAQAPAKHSQTLLAPGSLLHSPERERDPHTLTTADLLVRPEDAHAVAQVYQRWLVEKRNFAPALDVKPMDVHHAKRIIAKAGGDVAQAKRIVACFVDQDRKFYKETRWPLSILSRDDLMDFETINGIVREAIGKKAIKTKDNFDE